MSERDTLFSTRFDRSLIELERRRVGRVQGVWSHAVLLRDDEEDGELLTLVHPSRGLVPNGIEVDWDQVRPREGQPFLFSGGWLRLGSASPTVRLEGRGVLLQVKPRPLSVPDLGEQVRALRLSARTMELLGQTPPGPLPGARPAESPGASSPVAVASVRAAARALVRLATHLCSCWATPGDFVVLTQRLVGLGPGSTPTGDDILAGVAAAGFRLVSAGQIPSGNFKAFLDALDRLPRDSTTPVAREMLRHAGRGRFPEPLLRLVQPLGNPWAPVSHVEGQARRLQDLGEQTGCDMLAGVLALVYAARSSGGGVA